MDVKADDIEVYDTRLHASEHASTLEMARQIFDDLRRDGFQLVVQDEWF